MSGIITDNLGRSSGLVKAAAGGGKILQVQSFSTVALTSESVSTSFLDISSFLVTITPATTSSKILIAVSLGIVSSGDQAVTFAVERAISGGATTVLGGTALDDRLSASFRFRSDGDNNHDGGITWNYVDSPSTVSEITYQLQWAQQDTVYLNRSVGDADIAHYGARTISGMIAMEIGA
jgi:hypothetical protein